MLRPYQLEIVDRVAYEVAAGRRRVLLVLATGAGKTVVAASIISTAVQNRNRVLLMAHRRELVAQASQKLQAVGIDCGIIQAGYPTRPGEKVQVASVQTLHARAIRTALQQLPVADVVVVDEAHHVRARTYRRILQAYPDAVVLGLTATPCRSDGRGLGAVFDVIVEGPPIAELIEQGFLVPTRVYAPATPDLTGIKIQHGDYSERQLAARMDDVKLVGDIVTHWFRLAERRRTVIFATGVAHSLHIRDEFRRAGVLAEHIDGETPIAERDAILAQLAAGKIDVVCNCAVLTEGWDRPEVSCLVVARPTKSISLYRQMVGRVLRPFPGKTDALILDHAGAIFEHGFVDEPVTWTLAEDRRAERSRKLSQGLPAARALTTCPECGLVRWSGSPCASCGWRPRTRAAGVEMIDGELAAVGRDRKPTAAGSAPLDRELFYCMLLGVARQRGYKDGWAAHKFFEKFKAWPRRSRAVEPVAPDDATLSWVRSRQIAYARSRARAAA